MRTERTLERKGDALTAHSTQSVLSCLGVDTLSTKTTSRQRRELECRRKRKEGCQNGLEPTNERRSGERQQTFNLLFQPLLSFPSPPSPLCRFFRTLPSRPLHPNLFPFLLLFLVTPLQWRGIEHTNQCVWGKEDVRIRRRICLIYAMSRLSSPSLSPLKQKRNNKRLSWNRLDILFLVWGSMPYARISMGPWQKKAQASRSQQIVTNINKHCPFGSTFDRCGFS